MSDRINRWSNWVSQFTIATTLAASTRIDYEQWSAGLIFVPSTSNLTSMTFYGAPWNLDNEPALGGAAGTTDYTYLAIYDETGTQAVITVTAAKAYAIPVACFGARSLKIVGAFSSGTSEKFDLSIKG